MTKKCIKCGSEKDSDTEFPHKQPKTSPYIGMCLECIHTERNHKKNAQRKARRNANIEEYRAKARAYKDTHPEYRERARITEKERYHNNKDKAAAYSKQRYIVKKEEIREYKKKYRENNKDSIKAKKHAYYLSIKGTPYYIQNKQEYRINSLQSNKIYFREKYRNDIEHRISALLRGRLSKILKRGDKSAHTLDLLGCSKEFFVMYLRGLYSEGMTDELLMNGSIHIDHIRPCASFTLSNRIEQYICTNYRNLRPMWASENLTKNSKYDKDDNEYWNRVIWPDIKSDLLSRGIIDSSYEGC